MVRSYLSRSSPNKAIELQTLRSGRPSLLANVPFCLTSEQVTMYPPGRYIYIYGAQPGASRNISASCCVGAPQPDGSAEASDCLGSHSRRHGPAGRRAAVPFSRLHRRWRGRIDNGTGREAHRGAASHAGAAARAGGRLSGASSGASSARVARHERDAPQVELAGHGPSVPHARRPRHHYGGAGRGGGAARAGGGRRSPGVPPPPRKRRRRCHN